MKQAEFSKLRRFILSPLKRNFQQKTKNITVKSLKINNNKKILILAKPRVDLNNKKGELQCLRKYSALIKKANVEISENSMPVRLRAFISLQYPPRPRLKTEGVRFFGGCFFSLVPRILHTTLRRAACCACFNSYHPLLMQKFSCMTTISTPTL